MLRLRLIGLLACLAAFATGSVLSGAAFTDSSENPQTVTAATDFVAPALTGSAVVKAAGGDGGYIRPGGQFYAYAAFSDTGAPASGVASASATLTNFDAGASPVTLTSGSFTADGNAYGWRSGLRTARSLANGTQTGTMTATDAAANTGTPASVSVTIDGTAPTATDIGAANGGTANRPDTGDTITYTFSEAIDRESILAGWPGTSTEVRVRLTNSSSSDLVTVWNAANTAQLPVGSLNTRRNFILTSTPTVWQATMTRIGAQVVVVLGARLSGNNPLTVTTSAALQYTPTTTMTDRAGNPLTVSTLTEPGTNDRDF